MYRALRIGSFLLSRVAGPKSPVMIGLCCELVTKMELNGGSKPEYAAAIGHR
jgi:hypothetical protein